jgi:hypothetical protein
MPLLEVVALGAILTTSAPGLSREAVRYVLAESTKSITPAGERASAVRGTVTVLDGTARWDLETGTFPRTRSSSVVLGDRGGWLVDRKASVAARASTEDFRALFIPPAEGDAGPFQSVVKEVTVSAAELSKGPDFEGRVTVRLRTTASWSLVTSMPGCVSRVRCRLTAVLDTLEELTDAVRSPLDELDRLLDVPAAVREALAPELARARGFAVGVTVETEAELAVDYPGTTAPSPDGGKPLKTRTESTRAVTSLVARPAADGDAAAFALPEETRVVGIERLVESRETLR